jgi:hypothetical protein
MTTHRFPFPIEGIVEYASGGRDATTSPAMSNVRPRVGLDGSPRGRSRPGIAPAYSGAVAGSASAVRWLGWLDTGFGDHVEYSDTFDYASGTALSATTNWSGAEAGLDVQAGYVTPASAGTLLSGGSYQGFAGDTWQDFELQALLQWTMGTDARAEFWVGSDATGADGCYVSVVYDATELAAPLLGFVGGLTITLTAGSTTRRWSGQPERIAGTSGGLLRAVADAETVRLYWRGKEVLSVPRDDGVCSSAGFKLRKDNPSTELEGWESFVSVRLLSWRLRASSRSAGPSRELLAVAGDSLGREDGLEMTAVTDNSSSWSSSARVEAAACGGMLFLVDGGCPKVYRPAGDGGDGEVADWTARHGAVDASARGIVNWRNRLVLYGSPGDPLNWTMSRRGDPFDFDYAATDAAAAVSGSVGQVGRLGEPIVSAMPVSDEVLVFGCRRSLWMLRGDPQAGGWVDRLSETVGLAGPRAWCLDDTGRLYVLGSAGLYRLSTSGRLENLSAGRAGSIGELLDVTGAGSAGEQYVTLAYDAAREGVAIFRTPYASGVATHYFLNLRTGGLFPESYPEAIGPTSAAFYPSLGSTGGRLILGGRNGRLYALDDDSGDDVVTTSSAAVSSTVLLPPRAAGTLGSEMLLSSPRVALTAGSDAVTCEVLTAGSLDGLAAASPAFSASVAADTPLALPVRARGTAVGLRITGSGKWALEAAEASVVG